MKLLRIAVDRGGTFTDAVALYEGNIYTAKVLSQSDRYEDPNIYAVATILAQIDGKQPDRIEMNRIASLRLATTVATNALLEGTGEAVTLVVNSGFEDLLRIGDQRRDGLFSVGRSMSRQLYRNIVTSNGRLGIRDDRIVRIDTLDKSALQKSLQACDTRAFAVVNLHAYDNDEDERAIASLIRRVHPEALVSCSSDISVLPGIVDRGQTTVVDAYLTPVLQRYIASILAGLEGETAGKLYFMRSDGGLCEAKRFRGADALLSGPAGGVKALEMLYAQLKQPLIGFDMGGTSTDVSRVEGKAERVFRKRIAGIEAVAPCVDLHTVAAGGGSRLFYRNGLFEVGPQSAGSSPGPVCYGKGGYLAITDANVVTGRVDTAAFPSIFGENDDAPLDGDAARRAFEPIAKQAGVTVEACAEAFIEVAEETMANAVKEITFKRGHDSASHILVPFGGAGGQHAVGVARRLGISRIYVPKYAAIFSAVGVMAAAVESQQTIAVGKPLKAFALSEVLQRVADVDTTTQPDVTLLMHFEGSETALEIEADESNDTIKKRFLVKHRRYFGFNLDRAVMVQAAIVTFRHDAQPLASQTMAPCDVQTRKTHIYLHGTMRDALVYETLSPGLRVQGPALLRLEGSVLLLDESSEATVMPNGDIDVRVYPLNKRQETRLPQAAYLSLMANRFDFIARHMGDRLKRTAVSVNIKEREDFSCAVFDAKGRLIVNAPHIPVHLGAMSETIRDLLQSKAIDPGSVYVCNVPYRGGSHLPDVTVMTPCFIDGVLRFWVASRGHHADIGGKVPGSMPANSIFLDEEGARFEHLEVVREGRFDEASIRAVLNQAGARGIEENISDIRAAVSANQSGIEALRTLWHQEGEALLDFMRGIRAITSGAVRRFLRRYAATPIVGQARLDNGATLNLEVRIDKEGNAVFDFSRSDEELWGNQNTPYAVVKSALSYALRLMIQEPLPLNEGLLEPVQLKTYEGTLLHPSPKAAVAGGNVTTSQRIVDVILHAFGFAADSQGCMNNVVFGNEDFGYYETIGGGEGAWQHGEGRSGIHTHMTNTKITDVEIIERRYPVRIERFALRRGSGGDGRYRGGDGLVREYRFLAPVEVSLLTERRVLSPRGLAGGKDAKCGRNLLITAQGDRRLLPPKVVLRVDSGDRLRIETPGGGGYGTQEMRDDLTSNHKDAKTETKKV